MQSTIHVNDFCYEVISSLKKKYILNRYLFIDGQTMITLMKELGVTEHDIYILQNFANQLKTDPTLPFRKSRNARYKFDYDINKIDRLIDQPFILSKEEDFHREDSDIPRTFDPIENDIQYNIAFNRLLLIKYLLIKDIQVSPRKNLIINSSHIFSTVFFLRTITTKDILGEPAKEGVHSDGVEHTMTTFINSHNISKNSAITRIHSFNEKNGLKDDNINTNLIHAEFQHKNLFDTLLIVDSEFKHSVSPIFQETKQLDCYRDMLIFFSRKQKSKLHPSYSYDKDEYSTVYPLSLSIK